MRSPVLLSFGSWKEEQGMRTLEDVQAELTQELQRHTGIWLSTVEKRHVREQTIGRLCAPFRRRKKENISWNLPALRIRLRNWKEPARA